VTLRNALFAIASTACLVGSAFAADPPKAPADVPAAVTPSTAAATNGSDSPCTGTLTGAVKATFACTVTVTKKDGGLVAFQVMPVGDVKGLKSFSPATFSIKGPVTVQTYFHRDLAEAHASAVTSGGKKFSASENLGDRGDIEVQVQSMEMTRNRFPLGTVHVHAHLVPAGAKDKAEIQVDIQFEKTW
jgi:hypothetical protein